LEKAGIAFHHCDLSVNPTNVLRLSEGCDAVAHAAALSAPWGRRAAFLDSNVRATGHTVRARENSHVRRLVHVCSPSVIFDFAEQSALKEDALFGARPANDYRATKRDAEQIIAGAVRRGLDAVVLRPKALFGPGDTTLLRG